MRKEKRLSSLPYLASIAFCLWFVSLSFHKYMKLWIIHWWNTNQFEILFNPIQEKHIFERFIELEELFILDEMIKEYPKTYIQKPCIGIHKETIKLVKIHNEYNLDILFHFSKNLICFTILSTYFILNNKELLILNSWVQEFLCNLSDTKKAFFILFITDLALGFHSTRGWEFLIDSVYKDFGLAHRDQILSGLASLFPIILDTIVKYWIFACLNRVSPSLVVIYHSIKN